MQIQLTSRKGPLFFVTIVPEALLAIVFLALGAMTLFSPDVPEAALLENTLVGVILLTGAAVSSYAVFRPNVGGILMIAFAVLFGLTFNGFYLSSLLIPGRDVGYNSFWSAMTAAILLLGVLSVARGRRL